MNVEDIDNRFNDLESSRLQLEGTFYLNEN